MARIRTIKPELPQSESLAEVSREARLLFLLLQTIADDEGRLRGAPRMLASQLYPYDQDAGDLIEGWLAELESRAKAIVRYRAGGLAHIQILDFIETAGGVPDRSEWAQRVDHPSKSKLPRPPAAGATASASVAPAGEPAPLASPREPSRDVATPPEHSRGLAPLRDHDQDHDLTVESSVSPSRSESSTLSQGGSAIEDFFAQFKREYPATDRAFADEAARREFRRAVGRGADPAAIVAAAKRFADQERKAGRSARFVMNAEKWLKEDRHRDYPAPATRPEPAEAAPAPPADPRWAPVYERLAAALGADVASSWFGKVRLVSIENGSAVLGAPTPFARNWIEGHYRDHILAALRAVHETIERVTIGVGACPPAARTSDAAPAEPEPASQPGPPAVPMRELARQAVLTEGASRIAAYLGGTLYAAVRLVQEHLETLGGDAVVLFEILAAADERKLAGAAALGWIKQEVAHRACPKIPGLHPPAEVKPAEPPAKTRRRGRRAG